SPCIPLNLSTQESNRDAQFIAFHAGMLSNLGAGFGAGRRAQGTSGARDFKPETSYNGIFRKPELLNPTLKLLWVGTATAELYRYLKPCHGTLDQPGVRHIFYELPGTSHEWLTWRRHMNESAPRLFR